MHHYELVYIARQDLSPVQVEQQTEALKKIVETRSGKVSKIEYWGLRKLAYDIKKNSRGHYTLLNITAPSETMLELERQMRLNENILRYLTISVEKHDDTPSIMMKQTKSRFHYEQPTIQVDAETEQPNA